MHYDCKEYFHALRSTFVVGIDLKAGGRNCAFRIGNSGADRKESLLLSLLLSGNVLVPKLLPRNGIVGVLLRHFRMPARYQLKTFYFSKMNSF